MMTTPAGGPANSAMKSKCSRVAQRVQEARGDSLYVRPQRMMERTLNTLPTTVATAYARAGRETPSTSQVTHQARHARASSDCSAAKNGADGPTTYAHEAHLLHVGMRVSTRP